MKKIIATLFIAAGLASCGGRTIVIEKTASTEAVEENVEEKAVVETAAPRETAPELSAEETFIAAIMADYSWVVNNMGRVKLVDLGRAICGSIDEGMSFTEYLDMVFAYDIDAGVGGAILRESVYNFCPGEQWFLDAAIDELSRS